MYLDDGVSRSSAPQGDPNRGADEQARSEYRETEVEHFYDGKSRHIRVNRVHDGYTPKFERYFFVAVLHDSGETKTSSGCLKGVKVNGQEIDLITGGTPEQRSDTLKAGVDNAWYHNENNNTSFIKIFDDNPSITVTAEYA
jgi:alpha-glucosidase